MSGEYKKYFTKGHAHKPSKGKGSYTRKDVDEEWAEIIEACNEYERWLEQNAGSNKDTRN